MYSSLKFLVLAGLGLFPALILADVVYLNNGDRISGMVAEGDDGQITVTSDYGGSMVFAAGHIERVERGDGSSAAGEQISPAEQKVAETLAASADQPAHRNWDANLDLASNISRGNSDNQALNLNAGYELKKNKHRYTLKISSDRKEEDGEATKEQDKLDFGYKYLFAPHWFFASNVIYERDPIALLDRRISVTPAIGYIVWEEEHRSLDFQFGAGYADEQADGVDESTSFVEWRLDYEQDVFAESMEFFHNHRIYRNISGRKNTVFNSETGFRYSLMEGVYLKMQFDYDYDTEPPVGTEDYDLTFLVGAGVDF